MSLKGLYLVIVCNLTHLQDFIFILKISEKIHVGSHTGLGSETKLKSSLKIWRSDPQTIIPQHCCTEGVFLTGSDHSNLPGAGTGPAEAASLCAINK